MRLLIFNFRTPDKPIPFPPKQALSVRQHSLPVLIMTIMAFSLVLLASIHCQAETDKYQDISGQWLINYTLSDDTDRQVEKAIKAAGGRISSNGKKGRGRYRGGPQEHELYDHISYDDSLNIIQNGNEFRFNYDGGFQRIFFTDGRGRVASATEAGSDYSFGGWENQSLLVEARPRDGGATMESYTLQAEGAQLHVQLKLQPLSFIIPIEILRIYDRGGETE